VKVVKPFPPIEQLAGWHGQTFFLVPASGQAGQKCKMQHIANGSLGRNIWMRLVCRTAFPTDEEHGAVFNHALPPNET
jgi:hypothetical protein